MTIQPTLNPAALDKIETYLRGKNILVVRPTPTLLVIEATANERKLSINFVAEPYDTVTIMCAEIGRRIPAERMAEVTTFITGINFKVKGAAAKILIDQNNRMIISCASIPWGMFDISKIKHCIDIVIDTLDYVLHPVDKVQAGATASDAMNTLGQRRDVIYKHVTVDMIRDQIMPPKMTPPSNN